MKKHTNLKGFTLIELIVVIAIISVLSTLLIPQVIKYIAKAQEAVCLDTRKNIEQTYSTYIVNGSEPTIEQLKNNTNELYFQGVAECPRHGEYTITIDKVTSQLCCMLNP